MARQIGPLQSGDRILDPAIGSGVLACAVVEQAVQSGKPLQLTIDAYEIDPELAQVAREVLAQASERAAQSGVELSARVHECDFIMAHAPLGPIFDISELCTRYDRIIANPPYFKLNRADSRVQAVEDVVNGYTNVYTLFMAISLRHLHPSGRACFIVPRSFCSGAYFAAFRRDFVRQAAPVAVHLFASREEVFGQGGVLQENVILTFRARQSERERPDGHESVLVSTSHSAADLRPDTVGREVPLSLFLGTRDGNTFFRLPTDELEETVVRTVDRWGGSLEHYGLRVSTGPVVAFRARALLSADTSMVRSGIAAPLLWMQNVRAQRVDWPVTRCNKPQAILLSPDSRKLLVPLQNYVLLRRFSAKEERRRLVAAPLLAADLSGVCQHIGLENHLNYVYRAGGVLTEAEAIGLSALLNSRVVDLYFRAMNGNTQVNAADLRALPLPPIEIIERIGHAAMAADREADSDVATISVLHDAGLVPALLTEARCARDDGEDRGSTGHLAIPGIAIATTERDISPDFACACAVVRDHAVE